jgi:hypothetical protein
MHIYLSTIYIYIYICLYVIYIFIYIWKVPDLGMLASLLGGMEGGGGLEGILSNPAVMTMGEYVVCMYIYVGI